MVCHSLIIEDAKKKLVELSFTIDSSLALVGESGSGKSLTLKALLDLLPSNLRYRSDIEATFKLTRGDTVSFVPQNAFTAFSPMTRIKDQWLYTQESADELFDILNLNRQLFDRFPSELSGGELQRVVIAIALASRPKLILLDEPTTALDPALREEMVMILLRLQERFGFLMLFVTHDIKIAQALCRDILVLKDGRVVEQGRAEDILKRPRERYTKELIEAGFINREFRA